MKRSVLLLTLFQSFVSLRLLLISDLFLLFLNLFFLFLLLLISVRLFVSCVLFIHGESSLEGIEELLKLILCLLISAVRYF
jgi:hypothetical protein